MDVLASRRNDYDALTPQHRLGARENSKLIFIVTVPLSKGDFTLS